MSEVMRWKLKGFIPGVEGESKAVFQPVVVLAEDYDSAARLFLDAAERCLAAERREAALQLRLNAADQRIDELTAKPSDAERERLMEIIERCKRPSQKRAVAPPSKSAVIEDQNRLTARGRREWRTQAIQAERPARTKSPRNATLHRSEKSQIPAPYHLASIPVPAHRDLRQRSKHARTGI